MSLFGFKAAPGQPAGKSERLDDAGPVPTLDSAHRQAPPFVIRLLIAAINHIARHADKAVTRWANETGDADV